MSSSFKQAPWIEHPFEVQTFPYPEARDSSGEMAAEVSNPQSQAILIDISEVARREEVARQMGRQEGEASSQAAFETHLVEVRDTVVRALLNFAQQRAEYYLQIEAEVVRLALSIARKILHREAQVDPLLLAGIVRVALEKIDSGTKVIVKVNPLQGADCRNYFAQRMEPRNVPEVIEDQNVGRDHCVVETTLGRTELGMEVQLQEIELGLMDLMAQRPKDGPPGGP